jgi:integrase
MGNSKVALLRYVKIAGGWRRVRVEAVRRGRGWDERLDLPERSEILQKGQFQLRWHKGSRAVYKGVGLDLQEAITARDNQIANLEAERAARVAGRKLVSDGPGRVLLDEAKQRFIQKKRLGGRDEETISAYESLLSEFLTGSGKVFADQIEELDLLQFCDGLRERGLSERTVMNYYSSIATFLRSCGIDHKSLVAKEHRPHKEDPDPVAYTEDEINGFLAACNSERDRLFFEFLLKTGAREKEATHAEWNDISWTENAITIHDEKNLKVLVGGKEKKIKFRTKTRRSRDITLEGGLLLKLKEWRKKNPSVRFIFGTSSDLPNGHFLETCKETARRAGLNCKHCQGCVDRKECEDWFLHKFRATFATWALQHGVDIRTVQKLMGHTKLEMTARYLAPAKGKAAQDKLNGVFARIRSNALTETVGA